MEEKELTKYDLTDFYVNEIQPAIIEIKKKCKLRNLPFAFVCAVKNDKNGTEYKKEHVLTGSCGITLKNNMFEQYLAALCGFDLVPAAAFTNFQSPDDKNSYAEVLDDAALQYIYDGDESNDYKNASGIEFIGDIASSVSRDKTSEEPDDADLHTEK